MSYEKQGFASGDVLYATQLNAMDDQIADNEEEITGLKSALNNITVDLPGTQLFDKSNAEIINAFYTNGIVTAGDTRSVIVPISPTTETTVTVHRSIITSRFQVTTFTEKPVIGMSGVNTTSLNSSESITVGIDNTIRFLLVFVWRGASDSSIVLSDVLDGLMVQYGSTYTGYEEYTVSKELKIENNSIESNMLADSVDEHVNAMIVDATADFAEFVNSNKEHLTEDTEESLTWIDGEYYNLTTGAIITSDGYSRTEKSDCQAGDIIRIENNRGQILWFDNSDNLLPYESTSYNSSIYRVAPASSVKYSFNNSDISARATTYHKISETTEIISHVFKAPAKLICDSDRFDNGQYVSTANGKYYTGSAYNVWYCIPIVKVEPLHKYRTQNQAQVVFYTEQMQYISAIDNTVDGTTYTGLTIEMDFETPSNCKYIAINSKSAHEQLYDVDTYAVLGTLDNLYKLHDKTIVCFGDSITGNYGFGDNYPYQIEKNTGAKTYNCGFGGCRMELLHNDDGHTNPFSMCGIVDALEAAKNGDANAWADQDQYALGVSSRVFFRLQVLKSIDFSKVDIVSISYGTNEYGYPQDDVENPTNKYTYAGATRYAINKLLTLYPKIRIVLLTPIFRWFSDTNESSDTKTHPTYGGKLTDNVATLIEVGKELKLPVIDMYYTLGINSVNYTSYFGDEDEQADGTHVNSFGREQMGKRIAGELIRLF